MNWRYFPKQTNVVGVHQTRLILKEMLNKDLHAKIKKMLMSNSKTLKYSIHWKR